MGYRSEGLGEENEEMNTRRERLGTEGAWIAAIRNQRATKEHNMIRHITNEFSTKLIDWSPFVIRGNTMPPRDPEDDEEDEDEEEEEEEEHRDDEPPVVREPDED